ncbi:4'-phosphopantetheinyl transferase superfamily protein [Methylicorpusculum oleiharenae]|uniref:4'-phosphopantetheinyl transferase family protein n=1 Tax=Methylicorpusculum oleiharenae TaxID=1338687 RepID=UPI0013593AD4|nr:4'-phosphopantetheinyl transferase superfamily protein [Methylicorpusculum oleiharenae]MCD2453703.1 4'-phosphopantetheinyl transferase superfamily protein [Methylicorpusculum oleiharenae]
MHAKPFLQVAGVDVWFEDLVASDADYQRYWRLLSAEENSIARRFVRDLDRQRYVVCHAKLRLLLSNYLNIAPECLCFARHAFGKPYLVDASGQSEVLQFNLSHSSDWMLLGVGKTPLGIDIEAWDGRHDLASLVDEILAPEEKRYWQSLSTHEQVPAFYRFWTRKESLVKAVGCGIGAGIRAIVTSTSGDPGFRTLPDSYLSSREWCIIDLDLVPGMSAALTITV